MCDRLGDGLGRGHVMVAIGDRKTATQIDEVETDVRARQFLENYAGMADCRVPDEGIRLLAADMERHPGSNQS